jgi:hypothetical protein
LSKVPNGSSRVFIHKPRQLPGFMKYRWLPFCRLVLGKIEKDSLYSAK